MEANIICMRHSLYNAESGNISKLGAALAYMVGKHLAENNKIDVILTSPKRRARQTAEIIKIAMAFNGEILQDKGLDEDEDFMCFMLSLREKIRSNSWKNILVISHGPNLGHDLNYCGYYTLSVSEKGSGKINSVFSRPSSMLAGESCEISSKLPPDYPGILKTLKKLPF